MIKMAANVPYLLLLLDDDRELCIWNTGVELTAHQCGSLIIFDVAHVFSLGYLDILGKTLQLEQTKG